MEHGHSIDETDENENTCLHIASMIGSHPVVQYLIEKGSNVEAKIRDQQIHIACEFGHLPIVLQYFIEKVLILKHSTTSSLHLASWNVQTDVVECLIRKGAN